MPGGLGCKAMVVAATAWTGVGDQKEYEVAIGHNPRLAKAYYDLGILYSQERRVEDSANAFRKYLEYGTSEDAPSRKDAEERLKGLDAASKPKKK